MSTKKDAGIKKEKFINNIISKMTLEQKVGQCFTYAWNGFLIHPSVVESIEKLHCGGLRITPYDQNGKRGKYYSYKSTDTYKYPEGYKPIPEVWFSQGTLGCIDPDQYAERINKLQKIATGRPGGIPLHISIDQEGDYSHDYPYGGINLFPSTMGLAATKNLNLVYKTAKAIALQLSAIGINCIHSPAVDVITTSENVEVGIRAFSDDPKILAKYATAYMKGLRDGGLITAAKHFPGRGDSVLDAHFDVPVINSSREHFDEVSFVPYRELIKNGLDCVMVGHSIYPVLDPSGLLSTVSSGIINDLLRGELGFKGVVTSDAIAMGAVIKKYGIPEACARALQAGTDLILNKLETRDRDQGFCETLKYVKEGKITEEDLNMKMKRILSMKYDRGLFKTKGQVNASKADKWIRNREIINLASTVARKSTIILRDREKLLPLTKEQKIMVIEQRLPKLFCGQNSKFHRLSFSEFMLNNSMNILGFDTRFKATAEEENMITSLLDEIDVVVVENYSWRMFDGNNTELIKKIIEKGKKVVLVVNSPYSSSVLPEAGTVICTFSSTPESKKAAADIIFGKAKAGGKWPMGNIKKPD